MSNSDLSASDVCAVLAGVLGVITGLVAKFSHEKSVEDSETLEKIRAIPTVRISDLHSILHEGGADSTRSKRVYVRGVVQPKPRSNSIHDDDGSHKGHQSLPNPIVLHSTETGQEAVVVKRTQTCIYTEKVIKEEKKQDSDLKPTTKEETRVWEETVSSTSRKVPFILAEGVQRPCSDYVIVDTEGSRHYLPLTTVYSNFYRLFHHKDSTVDLKADMLTKERILPVGKVLNAVGTCSLENGVPVIKPCNILPYFLTGRTKNQVMDELSDSVKDSIATSESCRTWSTFLLSYAAGDVLFHMFYKFMQKKKREK